jgi:hypothetical protein
MKTMLIAATAIATLAPVALPAPALALDRGRHEARQDAREHRREYRQDRRDDRRHANREWRGYRNYDWNRYEPGANRYYADRYYRSGSYYGDRRLTRYDRVYRGSDSRYYCRRDDGTTGLIIGAGLGALLGNQVDIGGSRTLNTILGGAAGAVIGQQIDRGGLRCD